MLAPLLLRASEEIPVELDTLLIVIDASGPKVDRIEVLDAPIVELGSISRLVPSNEARVSNEFVDSTVLVSLFLKLLRVSTEELNMLLRLPEVSEPKLDWITVLETSIVDLDSDPVIIPIFVPLRL